MRRDLDELGSLSAVGRRWQRNPGTIAKILANHGLYAPDPVRSAKLNRRPRVNGAFVLYPPATPAQIEAMIAPLTRVKVPFPLKREWRHWPMAKRAAFAARLHARFDALHPERRMPAGPLPPGFEPFAYGHAGAHAIEAQANDGLNSRCAGCKIKLSSRGLIWRGQLWFWMYDTTAYWGAYYRGSHRGRGSALHQCVWADNNGPIPESHVLRCVDGNPNNLRASNLALHTRNDVCRENHSRHYDNKGQAALAVILKQHKKKESHARTRHEQPLVELRADRARTEAARAQEYGRRQRAQRRARRAQTAA